MKLTRYSDYALRVSIYLAMFPDRLVSIPEIVKAYEMPHSNMLKLATDLVGAGFVVSVRGRSGGLRLARPAEQITLGQIVRHTEGVQPLVDCTGCVLLPDCALIGILQEARDAMFAVLDRHTLAQFAGTGPKALQHLFTVTDG